MSQIRLTRLVVVATALTTLTAACANDSQRASFSGGLDTPNESQPPAPQPSATTNALSARSIVLSPDGLGPIAFGTQAAVALNGVTQALGRAEKWSLIPAGRACAATRIFTWKNLDVLVNEATATSGSQRGLVGWVLRGTEPKLDFKTGKGVGIGSTVAAAKAAYGDSLEIVEDADGPTLSIAGSNGSITAQLDRLGDAGKVQTLRAGTVCAP